MLYFEVMINFTNSKRAAGKVGIRPTFKYFSELGYVVMKIINT